MSTTLVDGFSMPGIGDAIESTEREFMAGYQTSWQAISVVLDSTTVDSGNTPTTLLRRGLLLGRDSTTGQYEDYDPTATDGTQIARGFLLDNVNMLDSSTGSAADKMARMVWSGYAKADQLINLNYQARRQLRFIAFDDGPFDDEGADLKIVYARTTDLTVTSAYNNYTFSNSGASGAVNFTLPTLARGLRFRFIVEADQTVTVTSAAGDDMVVPNDASADSVAFSTAGDKIGGSVEVFANAAATKWIVLKTCSNAMTIVT